MFNFIVADKKEILPQNIDGVLIYVVGGGLGDLSCFKSLEKSIAATDYKFEAETMTKIITPENFKADYLIISSIGDSSEKSKVENAGGSVFDSLYRGLKDKKITILFDSEISDQERVSFLVGAHLKCYHFDYHRTNLKDAEIASILKNDVITTSKKLEKSYKEVLPIIDGVFTARDLVSEPANILNPETYTERCKELKKYGLKITVLDEKAMKKEGMNALLGVGQGSAIESKLVIMEWQGDVKNKKFPTALVGKGVCFDTGGISLKPGKGMWDMVFDMGGSASVVGTMVSLAKSKIKKNVVGVIGLVENMPDGKAQRPGDVVKTASGLTVEVLNTDAEGRLVLCDALWYVQKYYKPETIIDLATLTGAIIAALGYDYAGLFTNDNELRDLLIRASNESSEKIWSMPLDASMKKRLKSRVADIANIASSPEAGSSTAACFLEHFINEDVKWAHLDIAGTAWTYEARPTCPKGATGWGVRLLHDFIQNL